MFIFRYIKETCDLRYPKKLKIMCFDPKNDGALLWPAIHILAANAYTLAQRKACISFIESLKIMYPCQKCRTHYSIFLEKHPIEDYGSSAQSLLHWTWMLHNQVNIHLSKPTEQRLTWPQVRNMYMANCQDSDEENSVDPSTCTECQVVPDDSTFNLPEKTASMKSIPARRTTRRKYISVGDK
jgi:hypothetical protein